MALILVPTRELATQVAREIAYWAQESKSGLNCSASLGRAQLGLKNCARDGSLPRCDLEGLLRQQYDITLKSSCALPKPPAGLEPAIFGSDREIDRQRDTRCRNSTPGGIEPTTTRL